MPSKPRSEYHAAWREKNKDKVRAYMAQWREKNREKLREYARRYAIENKDKVRESRRRFEEKNRGRATTRYRRLMVDAPWVNLYGAMKGRSRTRGISCSLTRDELREMYTGSCAVTGLQFVHNVDGGIHPLSPSIDRVDPSLGYSKDNCRIVISAFNAFKGVMSDNEALDVARKIVSGLERGLPSHED